MDTNAIRNSCSFVVIRGEHSSPLCSTVSQLNCAVTPMKPSFLPSAFALCGLLVVSAANPSAAGLSDPLPFFKGVTVSCQTWGIEWQMPEMATALDELKSLGVNSIAIHPYAQIREDGHLLTGRGSTAGTTHITTPLRWARERGMSVMLVPHIAYWGTKFLWRGEI